MYLRKKKNLARVVESQFSEKFAWGLMGNQKISNIFGDYCTSYYMLIDSRSSQTIINGNGIVSFRFGCHNPMPLAIVDYLYPFFTRSSGKLQIPAESRII